MCQHRAAFAATICLGLAARLGAALAAPAPSADVDAQLADLQVKLSAGKVEESVKLGERAVEAAPANSQAWLWLGRAHGQKAFEASVLFKLGPANKAKHAFARTLELDPAHARAKSEIERLAKVAKS